jgi:DNA transposition AAA+ family ATPase
MTTEEKTLIAKELEALAAKQSQKKLANKTGISNATISQMINGNWELIKDEMWRKIKNALRIGSEWKTAETKNFKTLIGLLNAARTRSLSIGIAHDAGTGKSTAYRAFEAMCDNVVYIECKNSWSKKTYIKALLASAGIKTIGTTEEMIETFVDYLRSLDKPLVIIDQIDKLKDSQMDLFMDFYNDLEGTCGFILSGVPALNKRIINGVHKDKIGYRELYSRIGRKFIALNKVTMSDVAAICTANGISDEHEIERIYASADGDFRRVKVEVQKLFLMQKAA